MPILQGRPDFKKKENSERGDLVAVIYLLYPWEFGLTLNIDCLEDVIDNYVMHINCDTGENIWMN